MEKREGETDENEPEPETFENTDDSLGTLLERFYLSLTTNDPTTVIEAYVSLEAFCPDPARGESWEVQDEIVKDARRKCVTLIRAPYVDKTNHLNITSRKRLKQRTALSDTSTGQGGDGVAHGQRYMFIMMDVLGTWSNWLVELRGFGFRREMITSIMNNLYPRIIEIVWDTFQSFKQDKDLEKLCAKSTNINTELHLNTLDNTLQQLATMRSLINKHYSFQYDLFTPYFLIEYDAEEALAQVPLIERLVLVTAEELQKWKELDFYYSALEAAYLLRSITTACEEKGLLEIENHVFILHMVEDILFLMNKTMDRALLTAEESVVFALGNKLLELVSFGGQGGMQDALLYEMVSTSVLYRRVAQRGGLYGPQIEKQIQDIVSKCTGKNYQPEEDIHSTSTSIYTSNNSNSNGSSSEVAEKNSFQTPSKPPLPRPNSFHQNHNNNNNNNACNTPNQSNNTDSSSNNTINNSASVDGLDNLWKGANSWLTTLASPYIVRNEGEENSNTSPNGNNMSPTSPNISGKNQHINHHNTSPKTPGISMASTASSSAQKPSAQSLEELLLQALDDDTTHDPHGNHGQRPSGGEEDDYDACYNPDDPALLVSSATAVSNVVNDLSNVFLGNTGQSNNSASASSNVGVAGGFLLFSATSSLVSAFLSDSDLSSQNNSNSSNLNNTNSNGASNHSSNSSTDTSTTNNSTTILSTEQQKIGSSFETFLHIVFHEYHDQYPAELWNSIQRQQDMNENSSNAYIAKEGYLAGLMPFLPIPLQDKDMIVQLNTMMIFTQGICNLQEAVLYAVQSEDLFLSKRAQQRNHTNAHTTTKDNKHLQILVREYHKCIQDYRHYIIAEVQGLMIRQCLRHIPTLLSAAKSLLSNQKQPNGEAGVYGLVGSWLLGQNQQSGYAHKRNEQLLQATSLFLQSNFEITGTEMEQRWSLQLLRSFVNHFLADLAPLGPSFAFKFQEVQEIMKHGDAAPKFTFGGIAMSILQGSNKSGNTATGFNSGNTSSNHLSSGAYSTEASALQRSELCYLLARQYTLSFLSFFIRLLYEQCLLQRRFNEWGALLFQEEIRSFARYVDILFEDNSVAALSMRGGNTQDKGEERGEQTEGDEEEEEGMLSWRMVKKQLQRLLLAVKLLSLDAPADVIRYTFIAPMPPYNSEAASIEDKQEIDNSKKHDRSGAFSKFSGMKSSSSFCQVTPSSSFKGPAGAVEMSEDDIRAILLRRSDFSKDIVQKVKINILERAVG